MGPFPGQGTMGRGLEVGCDGVECIQVGGDHTHAIRCVEYEKPLEPAGEDLSRGWGVAAQVWSSAGTSGLKRGLGHR